MKDGFKIFLKNPLLLIGSTIVFLLMFIAISFIPIVNLAVNIILPMLIAGILQIAYQEDKDQTEGISGLFIGFKKNTGELAISGLLFMVGLVGIIVATAIAIGIFGSSIFNGQSANEIVASLAIPLFIIMILFLPLSMAIWYSTPLILFHNEKAFPALKSGIIIGFKNWAALLVYTLALLPLVILATIPVGLGWIVLLPVMYCSIYASYKDMYFK